MGALGSCLSTAECGSTTVNVLPTSGVLVTSIVPPIRSTSCLLRARPRPVPPYLRVIDGSAWLNDSNTLPRCSSLIPMPESSITNVTRVTTSGRAGAARRRAGPSRSR